MNLCSCCYDEATDLWCGCNDPHTQDSIIIEQAREYMNTGDMQYAEQWSYYCTACDRYTSGNVYYIDN